MHLGHDLIAQMQWETLQKLEPQSLPACVNLTALYTRLGKGEKARALSRILARDHRWVPMVAFNEAWFLAGENAPDAAWHTMAATGAVGGLPPRYAAFLRQLESMTAPVSGPSDDPAGSGEAASDAAGLDRLLHEGIAGRLGGTSSPLRWLVSVAVFALLSLVLLGIVMQMPRGKAAWFLVLGAVLYGLTWGLPQGIWWLLPGSYLLIGMASAESG